MDWCIGLGMASGVKERQAQYLSLLDVTDVAHDGNLYRELYSFRQLGVLGTFDLETAIHADHTLKLHVVGSLGTSAAKKSPEGRQIVQTLISIYQQATASESQMKLSWVLSSPLCDADRSGQR